MDRDDARYARERERMVDEQVAASAHAAFVERVPGFHLVGVARSCVDARRLVRAHPGTELLLLEVDPREQPDLWMLQGSVLAAVDHVLTQLDAVEDDVAAR